MSFSVDDIVAYIDFLRQKLGLEITLHGMNGFLLPYTGRLLAYTVHSNPYCLCVKSDKAMWDICIRNQSRVYDRCRQGSFFGVCYAGMGEFVLPVSHGETLLGFISVSGYRDQAGRFEEKLPHFAGKYGFDRKLLEDIFAKNSKTPPSMEQISACVQPLAAMLELLYLRDQISSVEAPLPGGRAENYSYEALLNYLRRHFASPIHLEGLGKQFHCSPSYISHLFKKRSGENISAYVNGIRLAEAANLLEKTLLPIKEIAYTVGYSDSNYFSTLFHRKYGLSPKSYRMERTADR